MLTSDPTRNRNNVNHKSDRLNMFDTCKGKVEFFGTNTTVCGDNPGSAAVAGFKETE